jgi:rubrerythrin
MEKFNDMKYAIKRFFRKIKNVFRWIPTIWKDEDYDDHFIVEILIKKLEHTRDFFLSDRTHITNAEKVAEEIQEAIDRLHMTRDSWEFYEQQANEIITEKWGKSKFNFIPTNDGTGSSYMEIEHENVKTPEDKEQYSTEFRAAMKQARKDYIKDKKEAYKFIAKNIDKWWD